MKSPQAEKEPAKPEEFDFNKCTIPSSHPYNFALDSHGVFQVYDSPESDTPLYNILTLKDFFKDLDFLVSVASDGPARSFAFRRMKFLESKWQMYALLNEYQELSDMKVGLATWLQKAPEHRLTHQDNPQQVPHRDFYNV